MTALLEALTRTTPGGITFLELEITRECQLTCASHCYAQAGPGAGHGSMTADDWKRVMADAARYGVAKVQLIGGEPTRHPAFAELLQHGLNCGLKVEVFSNLFRVREEWWELLTDPRASLATSYYSDDPAEHDAITGRAGSHGKTRANIAEAMRRGIPLKVGIIHMRDGQRSGQARAEMKALGVAEVHIDHVREVGNAAAGASLPSTSALCGRCANGIAAILPDGTVAPCVLGRFLPAGNVHGVSLEQVFTSPRWKQVAASIPRTGAAQCGPADCEPADSDSCQPKGNSPCGPMSSVNAGCAPDDQSCQPGQPACLPKFP